jgi:phage tail tape-measure protein
MNSSFSSNDPSQPNEHPVDQAQTETCDSKRPSPRRPANPKKARIPKRERLGADGAVKSCCCGLLFTIRRGETAETWGFTFETKSRGKSGYRSRRSATAAARRLAEILAFQLDFFDDAEPGSFGESAVEDETP